MNEVQKGSKSTMSVISNLVNWRWLVRTLKKLGVNGEEPLLMVACNVICSLLI